MAKAQLILGDLPEWASYRKDDKGNPKMNGASVILDIDTHLMYEFYFAEFRRAYKNGHGDFNEIVDGKDVLKEEWKDALADLHSDAPGAYWCECAYQFAKVDLQMAFRSRADHASPFALNLHMKDKSKKYRQEARPSARDPKRAAGVFLYDKEGEPLRRGTEARSHYRRIRGFFPS